jgi:hypothetical protein
MFALLIAESSGAAHDRKEPALAKGAVLSWCHRQA